MAIPDPPKAGSPFCALWTGGWNPKTPKINNFFIPEITLRGAYGSGPHSWAREWFCFGIYSCLRVGCFPLSLHSVEARVPSDGSLGVPRFFSANSFLRHVPLSQLVLLASTTAASLPTPSLLVMSRGLQPTREWPFLRPV